MGELRRFVDGGGEELRATPFFGKGSHVYPVSDTVGKPPAGSFVRSVAYNRLFGQFQVTVPSWR